MLAIFTGLILSAVVFLPSHLITKKRPFEEAIEMLLAMYLIYNAINDNALAILVTLIPLILAIMFSLFNSNQRDNYAGKSIPNEALKIYSKKLLYLGALTVFTYLAKTSVI